MALFSSKVPFNGLKESRYGMMLLTSLQPSSTIFSPEILKIHYDALDNILSKDGYPNNDKDLVSRLIHYFLSYPITAAPCESYGYQIVTGQYTFLAFLQYFFRDKSTAINIATALRNVITVHSTGMHRTPSEFEENFPKLIKSLFGHSPDFNPEEWHRITWLWIPVNRLDHNPWSSALPPPIRGGRDDYDEEDPMSDAFRLFPSLEQQQQYNIVYGDNHFDPIVVSKYTQPSPSWASVFTVKTKADGSRIPVLSKACSSPLPYLVANKLRNMLMQIYPSSFDNNTNNDDDDDGGGDNDPYTATAGSRRMTSRTALKQYIQRITKTLDDFILYAHIDDRLLSYWAYSLAYYLMLTITSHGLEQLEFQAVESTRDFILVTCDLSYFDYISSISHDYLKFSTTSYVNTVRANDLYGSGHLWACFDNFSNRLMPTPRPLHSIFTGLPFELKVPFDSNQLFHGYTTLSSLHPTQLGVGFFCVSNKIRELAHLLLNQDIASLVNFLSHNPMPAVYRPVNDMHDSDAVTVPKKQLFLIDHHHLLLATFGILKYSLIKLVNPLLFADSKPTGLSATIRPRVVSLTDDPVVNSIPSYDQLKSYTTIPALVDTKLSVLLRQPAAQNERIHIRVRLQSRKHRDGETSSNIIYFMSFASYNDYMARFAGWNDDACAHVGYRYSIKSFRDYLDALTTTTEPTVLHPLVFTELPPPMSHVLDEYWVSVHLMTVKSFPLADTDLVDPTFCLASHLRQHVGKQWYTDPSTLCDYTANIPLLLLSQQWYRDLLLSIPTSVVREIPSTNHGHDPHAMTATEPSLELYKYLFQHNNLHLGTSPYTSWVAQSHHSQSNQRHPRDFYRREVPNDANLQAALKSLPDSVFALPDAIYRSLAQLSRQKHSIVDDLVHIHCMGYKKYRVPFLEFYWGDQMKCVDLFHTLMQEYSSSHLLTWFGRHQNSLVLMTFAARICGYYFRLPAHAHLPGYLFLDKIPSNWFGGSANAIIPLFSSNQPQQSQGRTARGPIIVTNADYKRLRACLRGPIMVDSIPYFDLNQPLFQLFYFILSHIVQSPSIWLLLVDDWFLTSTVDKPQPDEARRLILEALASPTFLQLPSTHHLTLEGILSQLGNSMEPDLVIAILTHYCYNLLAGLFANLYLFRICLLRLEEQWRTSPRH